MYITGFSLRITKSLNPKTLHSQINSCSLPLGASMADTTIALEKLKAFWHSQVHDEEKWALNMKLLRAAGLFVGSIVLMRDCGHLMLI